MSAIASDQQNLVYYEFFEVSVYKSESRRFSVYDFFSFCFSFWSKCFTKQNKTVFRVNVFSSIDKTVKRCNLCRQFRIELT